MPTCHSSGREEPSVVLSRGSSIISQPKSLWERSAKKEYTYIRHASRLQHNWTEEWCEKIGLHSDNRYYAQSLSATTRMIRCVISFSVPSKIFETALWKSRPDNHETTRAIVSMNKEAGQNPQIISRRNICRDDLDPEKLEWLIWLSHNWKRYFAVNRRSDLHSTQRHHREPEEEHASGNREDWLSHLIIGGMHTGATSLGGRNQDGHRVMKSEGYFFRLRFRTHVVATAVCATGGCTHTLLSHAHFFWHIFVAWRTNIAYTHGSRCVQCACRTSPSRFVCSHVSSSVLAVPARSLRHHVSVSTVFVELYPTQKRGSSALPHDRRGVWLLGRSHALHGLWAQTSPTTPLLWTVTRRPSTIRTTIASLTSRKLHARTLDCSVFPQCAKRLIRTALMVILLFREKTKNACFGKPLQDREKERKEKVLWSVL